MRWKGDKKIQKSLNKYAKTWKKSWTIHVPAATCAGCQGIEHCYQRTTRAKDNIATYIIFIPIWSGQSFSSTYSGISVLISDICIPVYKSICWVIKLKQLIARWGYFQRLKFPLFQANFKHPHRLNSFYIYKTHTQSPVKLMHEMWRISSLKDCLYFSASTALNNVKQRHNLNHM